MSKLSSVAFLIWIIICFSSIELAAAIQILWTNESFNFMKAIWEITNYEYSQESVN